MAWGTFFSLKKYIGVVIQIEIISEYALVRNKTIAFGGILSVDVAP